MDLMGPVTLAHKTKGEGEVRSESDKSGSEQRPRAAESIQASVLGRRENQ